VVLGVVVVVLGVVGVIVVATAAIAMVDVGERGIWIVNTVDVGVLTNVIESAYEVDFFAEDVALGIDTADDLGCEGVEEENFHSAASSISGYYTVDVSFYGSYSIHCDGLYVCMYD